MLCWLILETTYLQNVICFFVSLRTAFLKHPLFRHSFLAPVGAPRYLKMFLQLWKAEYQHALWDVVERQHHCRVMDERFWEREHVEDVLEQPQGAPRWGQASPEPHALLSSEIQWVKISWGPSVRDAKVEDGSQNPSQEAPPGSHRWTTWTSVQWDSPDQQKGKGRENTKSHLFLVQKRPSFKGEVTEPLFTRNIPCFLLSAETGAQKSEFRYKELKLHFCTSDSS